LLQPNQSWRLQPPNSFDSGAATVDGDEDLSVSVLHELNSPYTLGAYAGIGQARIGALIPMVRRNVNGWFGITSGDVVGSQQAIHR
jgi:hypothetical protein